MNYYVAAVTELGMLVGLALIAWGYRRRCDEALALSDAWRAAAHREMGLRAQAVLRNFGEQVDTTMGSVEDRLQKAADEMLAPALAATAREEELTNQTVGEEWTPGSRVRCASCANLFRPGELADGLCDYCREG